MRRMPAVTLRAMDIVFIRHGQPQWAVDGLSQPDPFLTDLGHEQALLAAKRIANEPRPVTELIASPATRAQQTAAPIGEETGLEVQTGDDLTEVRMPDCEGVTEEKVVEIFKTSRHRSPEQWWEGLPGGESFRDFHNRVTTALDDLLGARGIFRDPDDQQLWHMDEDPGRIVVVAHGGTNSVSLTHLLGVPPAPWEWERLVLFHASFARIKLIPLAGGFVPSLRTFNDQDHIPLELRSR